MNPKELFQLTVKDADKFAEMTASPGFRSAICFAQAQAISSHNLNADEISGMKLFCEVLLNLGEKDSEPPKFPDKRLVHDLTAKPKEQKK